jgi:hypothetical protein
MYLNSKKYRRADVVFIIGRSPPGAKNTLALATRKHTVIDNDYCRDQPTAGDRLRVQDYIKDYPGVHHCATGPTRAYNCHGLTFGSRRAGISSPEAIQTILNDDGYKLLVDTGPRRGDVAIYIENHEITHSGIVVWLQGDEPWILSKWGAYHEAVHKPSDCPYNRGTVSYYRLQA